MEKNSLKSDSESRESTSTDKPQMRKLYFINEIVEWRLTRYIWTGCTQLSLRDEIMSHANELIRQIIRTQNLHSIYPGQDDSSFGDLSQTAWVQIERTLYKYRARPHCRTCYNEARPNDSLLYNPGPLEYGVKDFEYVLGLYKKCPKCNSKLSDSPLVEPSQGTYAGSSTILYRGMSKVFNMWSQISRTVILAHIKKECRDKKNSGSYVNHLGTKYKPVTGAIDRLLAELRDVNKHNSINTTIIDSLAWIISNDDKPHDGLIAKLVAKSGLNRQSVTNFLSATRLRSHEFSDSLLNREVEFKDNKNSNDVDDE